MGVPQRRARVFFLAFREDLAPIKQPLKVYSDSRVVTAKEISDYQGREIKSTIARWLWEHRAVGDRTQADASVRLRNKRSSYNHAYVYADKVCPTLLSKSDCLMHFSQPRYLSQAEVCKISSFPLDYDFCGQSPHYICGMSVPPLMMYHVACAIRRRISL